MTTDNTTSKMLTRRAYLRAAGAASVGIVGGTAGVSQPAAASHEEGKPSHVTIGYDEDFLQKYQPKFTFRQGTREKLIGQYALRATSPDYDTDVAVYWNSYTHQEGVSDYDSHYGDHEPLYVFVNEDGSVQQVVYSAYHWLAGRTRQPPLDGTHPLFHVVKPWHHYYTTTYIGDTVELKPLATAEGLKDEDITTSFESWLSNGLESSLAPGTVMEPWTMLSREDWWRRNQFGISFNQIYVSVLLQIGAHGASKSDIA